MLDHVILALAGPVDRDDAARMRGMHCVDRDRSRRRDTVEVIEPAIGWQTAQRPPEDAGAGA